VIFFDAEIPAIREVEIYNSIHPHIQRVYLLMYENSLEQQRFISNSQQEAEAFEQVEKIQQEFENQPETIKPTFVPSTIPDDPLSKSQPAKVLVDIREFRSSLPSLLHSFDLSVVPVTLEVGDYILSPTICIERKSIFDLIGSLRTGHLFKQMTQMIKYYQHPILLIEFDIKQPFCLVLPGKIYEFVSVDD
jgi:DNA excision repair protein ERCC-4